MISPAKSPPNNMLERLLRFILGSGINTLITMLIYWISLFFFSARVSFSVSWSVGILIVIVFYPRVVFMKENDIWLSRLLIFSHYIISFLIGLWLVSIPTPGTIWQNLIIIVVIAVNFIVNFLMTDVLLQHVLPKFKKEKRKNQCQSMQPRCSTLKRK